MTSNVISGNKLKTIFTIAFSLFLLTSNVCFALNLDKIKETHWFYKSDDGQSIYIIAKPDQFSIPYDVSVPFISDNQSYVISSDVEGLEYSLENLGKGYLTDRTQLIELDPESVLIGDYTNNGEPDLKIRDYTFYKEIILSQVNPDEADPSELEISGVEILPRDISANVISYENLETSPEISNLLPGATTGRFSIDAGGQVNYSLPIQLPMGLNNLHPSLSINYNSSQTYGQLGYGWSIGGFSYITRCPQRLQDGDQINRSVTFTTNDRLCLNGIRLIQVNENETGYLTAGAKYRLAQDSRIEVKQLTNSHLFYKDINDTTVTYKKINEKTWGISSIEDNFGNKINYSYLSDNASYESLTSLLPMPNKIEYGNYAIELQYQRGRNDQFAQVWFSSLRYESRFLKRIRVLRKNSTDNTEVGIRDYDLHYYNPSSIYNRALVMKEVQQCNYDELGEYRKCLLPLKINHIPGSLEFSKTSRSSDFLRHAQNKEIIALQNGDWDGDGDQDFILITKNPLNGFGAVHINYMGDILTEEILVSESEEIPADTIDVYMKNNGVKGIVYLTENDFTYEDEFVDNPFEMTMHFDEKRERSDVACKVLNVYRNTSQTCKTITTQIYDTVTGKDREDKAIQCDDEKKKWERGYASTGNKVNLNDQKYRFTILASDPNNPDTKINLGYGPKPIEAICPRSKNSDDWNYVLVYPSFDLKLNTEQPKIYTGTKFSHSFRWHKKEYPVSGITQAKHSYFDSSYCGYVADPSNIEIARKDVYRKPLIADTDGDGELEISVITKNNLPSECRNDLDGSLAWHDLDREDLPVVAAGGSIDISNNIYQDTKAIYKAYGLNDPIGNAFSEAKVYHSSGANPILTVPSGNGFEKISYIDSSEDSDGCADLYKKTRVSNDVVKNTSSPLIEMNASDSVSDSSNQTSLGKVTAFAMVKTYEQRGDLKTLEQKLSCQSDDFEEDSSTSTQEQYNDLANFKRQEFPSDRSIFQDLNNDGKTDVVVLEPDKHSILIYMAFTNGFMVPVRQTRLEDNLFADLKVSTDVSPINFNNDNLLDLQVHDKRNNTIKILVGVINDIGKFAFKVESTGLTLDDSARTLFYDYNGDGRSNIVVYSNTAIDVYTFNSSENPLKVSSFVTEYPKFTQQISVNYKTLNQLADIGRYTYQSSKDEGYSEFISNMSVVDSVRMPIIKGSEEEILYKYYSAKSDLINNTFLGFERIDKLSTLSNRAVHSYYNGAQVNGHLKGYPIEPFIGLLIREDVYNTAHVSGPTLLTSTVKSWGAKSFSQNTNYVSLSEEFSVGYDLSGQQISAQLTRFELDDNNFGHMKKVTAYHGYNATDPQNCFIGSNDTPDEISQECAINNIVKKSEVTTNYANQHVAFLNSKYEKVTTYTSLPSHESEYSSINANANFNISEHVTVNTPHRRFTSVVGESTSGTAIGSADSVKTVFEYGEQLYNQGQLISVTVDDVAGDVDSQIVPRKSSAGLYTYGQYPTEFFNFNDNNQKIATSLDYDLRYGIPNSVKDQNNLEVTVNYDELGIPVLVSSSSGTVSESLLEFCTEEAANCTSPYAHDAVFRSMQSVSESETADVETMQISFSDSFGRTLLTVSQNMDGSDIYTAYEYDTKGRLHRASLPFCVGGICNEPQYIQYTYFDTENKKQVDMPDNSRTISQQRVSQPGLVQSTTNTKLVYKDISQISKERNLKKVSYSNILGQITSVEDWESTQNIITTRYAYDALGRLIYTQVGNDETDYSADSATTLIAYNDVLLTKTLLEPNTGITITKSNVIGETVYETQKGLNSEDSNNRTVRYTYDRLGRITQKNDVFMNIKDYWYYDSYPIDNNTIWDESDTYHCGLSQLCEVSSNNGANRERYNYIEAGLNGEGQVSDIDSYLKSSGATVKKYSSNITYDTLGRPLVLTYPSGLSIKNAYENGYLNNISQVQEDLEDQILWQANSYTVMGGLGSSTLGNGVNLTNTFDVFGRLVNQQAKLAISMLGNIQNLSYSYDTAGNQMYKKRSAYSYAQGSNTATETNILSREFTYDGLNRLKQELSTNLTISDNTSTQNTLMFNYDDLGNYLGGGQDAQYTYAGYSQETDACLAFTNFSSPGPNAVKEKGQERFCYDEFGNLKLSGTLNELGDIDPASTRSIVYNTMNKPTSIILGNNDSLSFSYGISGSRYYQKHHTSEGDTETFYLLGGAFEERIDTQGNSKMISYVGDFLIHEKTDARESKKYILRDNQGSITSVLDEDSTKLLTESIIEQTSYSAFGEQIQSVGFNYTDNLVSITRGYTGHEEFGDFNIIHMNGRIYDPTLKRFLSADPLVQAPFSSQSYNRYSYVMNNPMSMVDPSGYAGLRIDLETKWTIGDFAYQNSGSMVSSFGGNTSVASSQGFTTEIQASIDQGAGSSSNGGTGYDSGYGAELTSGSSDLRTSGSSSTTTTSTNSSIGGGNGSVISNTRYTDSLLATSYQGPSTTVVLNKSIKSKTSSSSQKIGTLQESTASETYSSASYSGSLGDAPDKMADINTTVAGLKNVAPVEAQVRKSTITGSAQKSGLNPFSIIAKEFPKWASDVGSMLHSELVESKVVSNLMGGVSRYTGHAAAASLTIGTVLPVTAPVLIPLGVFLGNISFGSGVGSAGWDQIAHGSDTSTTALGIEVGSEYMQNNLTKMLPGPAKPFAYTAMEIQQTLFREALYQTGL